MPFGERGDADAEITRGLDQLDQLHRVLQAFGCLTQSRWGPRRVAP